MKKGIRSICYVAAVFMAGMSANAYAAPEISAVSASLEAKTINLVNLDFTVEDLAVDPLDPIGKVIISWGDGRFERHNEIDFTAPGGSIKFQHGYHDSNGAKTITIIAKYKCSFATYTLPVEQRPVVTIYPDFHFAQSISYQGPNIIIKDKSWDLNWDENASHPDFPTAEGVFDIPGMYIINWGDGTFTNAIPKNLTAPDRNKGGDRYFRIPHYYSAINLGEKFNIEYRVSYCNGETGPDECNSYYSSGPIPAQFEMANLLPVPDISEEVKLENNACILTVMDSSVDPDYDPLMPGDGYIGIWYSSDAAAPGYISFNDHMTNLKPAQPRLFKVTIQPTWLREDEGGVYIWYDTRLWDKGTADEGDWDMGMSMPWKKIYVAPTAADLQGRCGM